MLDDFLSKAIRFFKSVAAGKDPLAAELGEGDKVTKPSFLEKKTKAFEENGETQETKPTFDDSSSIARALMGAVGGVGDYHFPSDLIGGCCPRVIGEEQDIVWNAAAEASDTERVHLVWQSKGEKIWYLAVRSADMSSFINTWCPFASVLPGMKDAAQPPVIYTFFSDESATMMTILADGLQIHRGTSSVIRAKAERMSREQNDAPVVELIPDRIQKLTPVPWFSLSLFEERSRRVLAGVAVAGALAVAGLSVFVWLIAAMATVSAHADLREIQERTDAKSLQLLNTVQAQRASPMREQIAQFADVNDGLLALSGYLEVYQINDNKAEWRAVVPANVTSDRIRELGGQTLDSNPQGVVIGNVKDLQTNKKKRR